MTSTLPAVSAAAAWFGTWTRPTDRPAVVALALAAALVAIAAVPGGTGWLGSLSEVASVANLSRRRRFLVGASFAAAFLSLGYVALYLRGGPRAPEAAIYWLQGRALSHGALSWTAPDPTASFRASDLLFRAPDRMAGIFPPGYPLLLAVGFLAGAPMVVGPILAALLVVATWLLAHELGTDGRAVQSRNAPPVEAIARLAAGLSIASAALRHYTADAVPYGAAAAAVAFCLAFALRARRTGAIRLFGASGLAFGFLLAARPSSALAVGVVLSVLAAGASGRARAIAWSSCTALPGALFFFAANRAATGHLLSTGAGAYAAMVGRVVAGRLPLLALVCLRDHLLDIANLEPLALLGLVPLFGRRRRAVTLTGLVIGGETIAQLALHLDSGAPGAGAPLAASMPLEHVLIAFGVARLFPASFVSAAVGTIGISVGGFAVHASNVHQALAAADIGRPRFDPDVVREANVAHGLLFFADDAGFELAYDPGVVASHGIEAARMRGDDHDRILFDSLGRPPTHRYVAEAASASVSWWSPPNGGVQAWRFEAESDWPPVAGRGGTAEAISSALPCASDGRVLRLTPTPGSEASVTLALPVPNTSSSGGKYTWVIVPRVVQVGDGAAAVLTLVAEFGQPPVAEWNWTDSTKVATCLDLPPRTVEIGRNRSQAWLILRATGGTVMLDKTTIRPG